MGSSAAAARIHDLHCVTAAKTPDRPTRFHSAVQRQFSRLRVTPNGRSGLEVALPESTRLESERSRGDFRKPRLYTGAICSAHKPLRCRQRRKAQSISVNRGGSTERSVEMASAHAITEDFHF